MALFGGPQMDGMLRQNPMMLMAMASGLLGAPSLTEGLSRGFSRAGQGMQADQSRSMQLYKTQLAQQEQDQERRQREAIAKWANTQTSLSPETRELYATNPQLASKLSPMPGTGQGVYGTPIYGTDETGKTVLGVIAKDGSFRKLDTGSVTPTPGVSWQDFGTYRQPFGKGGQAAGAPVPKAGNVPEGYQAAPGGQSMAPISGSPAQQEQVAGEQKATERQTEREKYADIVTQDIDRIKGLVSSATIPTTGAPGSVAQYVPGTAAHDVSNLLDSIKANVTFDKLQAMRQASPTGGALGQVSNFENRLMQSTLGALEQSQTEAQFLQNLGRVKQVYAQIIHGGGQTQAPTSGTTSTGNTWKLVQ